MASSSASNRARRWWTDAEDSILRREAAIQLRQGALRDWNQIAAQLPDRTNKDCRKRWSKISEQVNKGAWSTSEDERLQQAVEMYGNKWTHVASFVGTRHSDQCAKRWTHNLDPAIDHGKWTPDEDALLLAAVKEGGRNWKAIGQQNFPARSATDIKNRHVILDRKRQKEELAQTGPGGSRGPVEGGRYEEPLYGPSEEEFFRSYASSTKASSPASSQVQETTSLPPPTAGYTQASAPGDVDPIAAFPYQPGMSPGAPTGLGPIAGTYLSHGNGNNMTGWSDDQMMVISNSTAGQNLTAFGASSAGPGPVAPSDVSAMTGIQSGVGQLTTQEWVVGGLGTEQEPPRAGRSTLVIDDVDSDMVNAIVATLLRSRRRTRVRLFSEAE